MDNTTRRTFLAVGGTGVAAAAAVPMIFAAENADAASTDSVVAYIKNASTGQVSVMQGEHEVVITDKALVATLTRALRS